MMHGRGRGIRTHKVELPKPRKRISETSKIQQTEVEKLLVKIKQGQILPSEAKIFNQTLKNMSSVFEEPSVTEFISSVIKSLRSSLMTEVFHPVTRMYLMELIELAGSGWQQQKPSRYCYQNKAETMPAVTEVTTSRALQHSVSCPGEVSSMTLRKEIRPSLDVTSCSVQSVADDGSCYNNDSISMKVETKTDVSKTINSRALQHSECSVYIKGHILKLCCDDDDILQQAAHILLSHFADDTLSPTVKEASNGQLGLEQMLQSAASPRLETSFSSSSSADLELWQESNRSSYKVNSSYGHRITTSHSMSCNDAMESSENTDKKEACARRASATELKHSNSTHKSCQVIQYGKTFLLACAKSPIATKQPEDWRNNPDLPAVCLTKPTSYFDPSTYRSPEALIPFTPESYMKHASLNTQKTNLAHEFMLIENMHS